VVERSALGEFLRSRRGRVRPGDVGLPAGIGRRQTPGLRREELAALAGVSVDYYTRLEQGRDANPGAEVLHALASALRLTDDERAHLHELARHASGRSAAARLGTGAPRPGLLHLLDAVRPTPAFVLDQVSNVLAVNPEGARLMPGVHARCNLIRYVFTDPAAREVFVSWREMAQDCVAHLRTVAAADPDSPALADLVAGLSADSAEFAALWRHYDVRVKSGARRTFRRPGSGCFDLVSEIVTAADGQRLAVFRPAPDDAQVLGERGPDVVGAGVVRVEERLQARSPLVDGGPLGVVAEHLGTGADPRRAVRNHAETYSDQGLHGLPVEPLGQSQARHGPSVGHESSVLRVLPDTNE
jgi:transcriptional regulator with XRE-family HTH domain